MKALLGHWISLAARRGGQRGGFAFIQTLAFLVVVLALGSLLVDQAIQELNTASRAKKETASFHLAEAGIDYAAWKVYNLQTPTLPVTWSRSDLGTGSFSVTASQYAGSSTTIQLLSTGTRQGWTSQVKVVGRFLNNGSNENNVIFNSALFSNADLTMKGTADVVGDIASNGNLALQGNPSVTGNARAAGKITVKGGKITGTQTSYVPKVPMPIIDLAYYRSIATTVVAGGYNFNGTTALNGITYVNGDCNISGQFSGTGMIVASGQVHVNGGATLSNPSTDSFAIVSAGGVHTNGHCRIEGFIYTHNIDIPAGFLGNGTADILGGVVADVVTSSGTLLVVYKKPTQPLPGATGAPAQFASVSWRRVK